MMDGSDRATWTRKRWKQKDLGTGQGVFGFRSGLRPCFVLFCFVFSMVIWINSIAVLPSWSHIFYLHNGFRLNWRDICIDMTHSRWMFFPIRLHGLCSGNKTFNKHLRWKEYSRGEMVATIWICDLEQYDHRHLSKLLSWIFFGLIFSPPPWLSNMKFLGCLVVSFSDIEKRLRVSSEDWLRFCCEFSSGLAGSVLFRLKLFRDLAGAALRGRATTISLCSMCSVFVVFEDKWFAFVGAFTLMNCQVLIHKWKVNVHGATEKPMCWFDWHRNMGTLFAFHDFTSNLCFFAVSHVLSVALLIQSSVEGFDIASCISLRPISAMALKTVGIWNDFFRTHGWSLVSFPSCGFAG